MGLFDSSSTTEFDEQTTYTYDEEDPYKFWRESGLSAGYSAATSELLRGIQEARDPESSALFRQGRQALTQGNAVANEQARQAMAGRGTAFSGQAATASRDILGGQNRALMDLLMGVRTQGYDLASQLGGLSASVLREPIYNIAQTDTTGTSTTTGSPSLFDSIGSVIGMVGDVASMGTGFLGGASPGGTGGGYSISADDLNSYADEDVFDWRPLE